MAGFDVSDVRGSESPDDSLQGPRKLWCHVVGGRVEAIGEDFSEAGLRDVSPEFRWATWWEAWSQTNTRKQARDLLKLWMRCNEIERAMRGWQRD